MARINFYQPPEPIYASLFAKVALAPEFITKGRRWQHWTDLKPEQQPALFQVQPDPRTISYDWRSNSAPIIRCYADIVIYSRTEETITGSPSIKINLLLAALFRVLEPPAYDETGRTALFDVNDPTKQVAYHVRVNGEISVCEGVAGDNSQSAAFVPLEILVNN